MMQLPYQLNFQFSNFPKIQNSIGQAESSYQEPGRTEIGPSIKQISSLKLVQDP